MDSAKTRRLFLDYFVSKGHAFVASSSLVPANDPTLLFVNSGMVQFKDVFTGLEKREYSRATTVQKCMRVSGKHNDLDDVGSSARHTTFFEMLGNFSFGDYFKEDAINYAWEFVTSVVGLSEDRIWPTVYLEDDEAFQLWQSIAGIPTDRIIRLSKKDNFWTMGDTGPCGPCSELIYDRGIEKCTCHRPDCHLMNNDCDRWWEFWNLVFMQFNLEQDGKLTPLSKPSVDTGMGLERMIVLFNGLNSVYDTDLFQPLLDRIQELTGHINEQRSAHEYAYRAIADHSRATAFMIADNIMPGNEGRNYILRLVMRRAIRYGKALGLNRPFMWQVVDSVIEIMGHHYHELLEKRDFIMRIISQEEDRFEQTLASGTDKLERLISEIRTKGKKMIPGEEVFRLYDTYGFPHVLTRDMAREHGFEIDEAGFNQAMDEQRERSRSASRFTTSDLDGIWRNLDIEPTRFVGYEHFTGNSQILTIMRGFNQVHQAIVGEEVEVILTETPFYGESGGQTGDTGVIEGPTGRMAISETKRPVPAYVVHRGHVIQGVVNLGDHVVAHVDEVRRTDIKRNHTATHLLHKALQKVLGSHAKQSGSLVAPDRLRFDFTHQEALLPEQITQIEQIVNKNIRDNLQVTCEITSFEEAIAKGATALFGEKYGDRVRVVSVFEKQKQESKSPLCYSKELCGGTHVAYTGEIGAFYITNESSIGSGLRRIEAVTGRGAETYARERFTILNNVATKLQTLPESVSGKVDIMLLALEQQRKDAIRLQRQLAQSKFTTLLDQVQAVGEVRIIATQVEVPDQNMLREMSDWLRDRLGSCVIILGAILGDKPSIVVSTTPDLVEKGLKAVGLAKKLGQLLGGGGGGRPTLAQAGGRDISKLKEALNQGFKMVKEQLSV